jgi:hypothetical protein
MRFDGKKPIEFSDETVELEQDNLEEETKYKLKLDAPSEPASSVSDDEESLDAFADAEGDEEVDLSFSDEKEGKGGNEKPFDDEPFDAGIEVDEDEDPEKFIQQLAGKLGTSLRKYNDERGEPDFDLEKYAINSVISATHTAEMDEEDQKDIIKKVKMSGAGDENDDIDKDLDMDSEEPKDDEPKGEEPMGDDLGFGDDEEISEMIPGIHSALLTKEEDVFTINLRNIKQDAEDMLAIPTDVRDEKLKGHKWADDHISTSADDAEEVADFLTNEGGNPCWDGYERVPGTKEGEKGSCRKKTNEALNEAEYKGKKVTLNKPQSCSNDSTCKKKYKVHVKNDKGNVIRVQFGDPNMEIRRDNAEAKKSFRARHKCSEKKDKTTAGYWSCKMWSNKKVSDITEDLDNSEKNLIFEENINMRDIILHDLHETTRPAPVREEPTVVPEREKSPSPRRRRIWETKPSVKPNPKMEVNNDIE